MRKVNAFLVSSVFLLTDSCPGLSPCFAGLYALVPRVLKSCVTSTSAVFEPGTAESTATHFPRFHDAAAFGACGTDGLCRGSRWCCMRALFKRRRKGGIIASVESMVDY